MAEEKAKKLEDIKKKKAAQKKKDEDLAAEIKWLQGKIDGATSEADKETWSLKLAEKMGTKSMEDAAKAEDEAESAAFEAEIAAEAKLAKDAADREA